MLLQPGAERVVEDALHHGAHLGRHQAVLGLGRELRVRHLDGDHGRQALPAIVAGERDLLLLGQPRGLGEARDLARQRAPEAREVRAAVPLGNVVRETERRLVERVVPPQRHLDADAVAVGAHHDRLVDQRRLRAVEVAHERLDPALVHQLLALPLGVAVVR
jgi:hypothetical protein